MKRMLEAALAVVILSGFSSTTWASTETDLAAAAAAGHPVFLVVTQGEAPGMDTARRVVSDAQKIAPQASVLEMDRGDRANEAVVKRYRLESVPVPLVLVIASNGVAAGGARPHLVTASRLAAMIPSPAKAELLKAIDEKKATFLVLKRESMANRAGAQKAAGDAVTALKGAAVVVPVDLDSDREGAFLAETKVDVKSAEPIVVVYNAKGQGTASFVGVPKVEDLVEAATKQVKSSCGPGGCGPNGCK
jgi:hypothetical protein